MYKVILALDQATNNTGWCIYKEGKLDQFGLINLQGYADERMNQLKNWLHLQIQSLLLEYKKEDILIVLEDIQLQRNILTFKMLAQLQGILMNEIFNNGVKYVTYLSSEWKKTCGVKGRNKPEQKKNAAKFVEEFYNIKAIQDTCDAICLGHHAVHIDKITLNFK